MRVFDQSEAIMVSAVVEFSAAFVACDRASDRSNALNDSEAV